MIGIGLNIIARAAYGLTSAVISLLNSLPSSATFTGGALTVRKYDGTLQNADHDPGTDPEANDIASFSGMRLATTVADGALLGDEELTNGDFSDGTTGWTLTAAESVTVTDGVVKIENVTLVNRLIYQTVLTASRTYRVTGRARGDGVNGRPVVRDGSSDVWSGTTSADWQTFDVTFSSGGTNLQLQNKASTGTYAEFDIASTKEVIPTFLATDDSGNAVHPVSGQEPQFYPERSNYESLSGGDFRHTEFGNGTPDFFYENNETSGDNTSLVQPLRNSDGLWYEEKVKNGSFDVDAEWTGLRSAVISVSSNRLRVTNAGGLPSGGSSQTVPTTIGSKYRIQLNGYKGTVRPDIRLGSADNSSSEYLRKFDEDNPVIDETITATSTNLYVNLYNLAGVDTDYAEFSDVSVYEVDANGNPTNILDGGRREDQTNMLTYSEDISAVDWSLNNAGYDNALTAPDGSSNGQKLTGTVASSTHKANYAYTFTVGGVHIYSAFVRATGETMDACRLQIYDGTASYKYDFDLNTGTAMEPAAEVAPIYGIEKIDDDWYRVWVGGVLTTGTGSVQFYGGYMSGGSIVLSWASDPAEKIGVWGHMLHKGMGASTRPAFDYIKTTTAAVTETANTRVEWDYSGRYQQYVGYLSCPAYTNTLSDNTDFDAAWNKFEVTAVTASGTAPDGTNTAVKLNVSSASPSNPYVVQNGTLSTGTPFASVYLKAGNVNFARVGIRTGTVPGSEAKSQYIDLANRELATTSSGAADVTFTVTKETGDWVKVEAQYNVAPAGAVNLMIQPAEADGTLASTQNDYILGWLPMISAVKAPTVKTNGGSVAVEQTVNSIPTPSVLSAKKGAIEMWVVPHASGQSGPSLFSSHVDSNNFIQIYLSSANGLALRKRNGGSYVAASTAYTNTEGTPVKIRAWWDSVNGMSIQKQDVGSTWDAAGVSADTSDVNLASTVDIGSINSLIQFFGNIPYFKAFASKPSSWD